MICLLDILRCKVGDYMFERLINRRADKHDLGVYKQSIREIYDTCIKFRNWVKDLKFESINEIECGSTLMDNIAAYIDIYTNNKFSRPSTVIGLRKGISAIGEGMTLCIDAVYNNTESSNMDKQELVYNMMHSFDLLMSGSRLLLHAITSESKEVELNVDIIKQYYAKKTVNNDDIKFMVSFTQPGQILGRTDPKSEDIKK